MLGLSLLLAACGARQGLSPADHLAFELSLAVKDDQGAVAWHGGPDGNALWLQRLDADARAVGAPVALTDGAQSAFEPDLQPARDGYWLAWYEKDARGMLTAWVAALDLHGAVRWRRALSGAGHAARNPLVRAHHDAALVAWIETPPDGAPAIWTARLHADGQFAAPAARRATVGAQTWNLNGVVDAGGVFHVVYDMAQEGRVAELYWLWVREDQSTVRPLGADDGKASQYPDIALQGDRVALTWFDAREGATQVYLATGGLSELGPGFTRHARRVSLTRGPSFGAYVSWNGGRGAVTWCDRSDGQSEVFWQGFGSDGAPLGTPRRLTRTQEESSIPSLRAWGRGFAVAWNEYRLPAAAVAPGHPGVASSAAMLQRLP